MQKRTREKANRKKFRFNKFAEEKALDVWTLKNFLQFNGIDCYLKTSKAILNELGCTNENLSSFQFHSFLFFG